MSVSMPSAPEGRPASSTMERVDSDTHIGEPSARRRRSSIVAPSPSRAPCEASAARQRSASSSSMKSSTGRPRIASSDTPSHCAMRGLTKARRREASSSQMPSLAVSTMRR